MSQFTLFKALRLSLLLPLLSSFLVTQAHARRRPNTSQRPTTTSICDYYTPQILGADTAAAQQLLITLLVNTFVIGNYTTPNTGHAVAGIAAPAVYNGTEVALLPYFTGELNSTNTGGEVGASKLFLDDGAAEPLARNMSSAGDVQSAQYNLLTHIYQYFGHLLGCSRQGAPAFPNYQGRTSMYEVHRYMNLDYAQMTFFITQVRDSAISLGIAPADAAVLVDTLNTSFNTRCSPATVITYQRQGQQQQQQIGDTPEFQAVCIADDCPLAPEADCAAYPLNGRALVPVNVTGLADSGSNSTGSGSGSGGDTGSAGNETTTSGGANGPVQTGGAAAVGAGFLGGQVWEVLLTILVVMLSVEMPSLGRDA
ncbi:hypothetical protein BJX68DRAFT_269027 [Aspergillus pseudodeflectus]|uniref:Uncharacterized protein n=1 Tax=Aspergillus pseudodeflectus TaxID=176178 RepID=A0ABR4K0G0_9EURO